MTNSRLVPRDILLIRHAQAEHNQRYCRVMGRAMDSPLTDLGICQAQKLARDIKEEYPALPVIYASSALRCQQTAQYLAQLYPGAVVRSDDRLLELDQGTFSNRLKVRALAPRFIWRLIARRWEFSFDRGETFATVAQRMLACVRGLNHRYPNQTIIVIGHGLAIRCLWARLHGWSVWRLILTRMPNTAYRRLGDTLVDDLVIS